MMKKNLLLAALALLLTLAAALCGTTMARMFTRTELLENRFDTAKVGCLVHEQLGGAGEYTQGQQKTDTKTSIRVENTGNIDAYIRLRFVTYWVDGDGDTVARPAPTLVISCADDWIAGADHTYYHKASIAPGAFTGELLQTGKPIALRQDTDARTGQTYFQVVEVFADAIQSRPAKAAAEKWGVTISDDGTIRDVP